MNINKIKSFLKKNEYYFFSFALLASSVVIYWRWVFLNEIFSHGDWMFWYRNSILDSLSIPQMWTNSVLGGLRIDLTFYPIYFILSLLSQVVEYKLAVKIVYFFPVVFILPVVSYKLFYKVTQNHWGSFISCLIFIYSTNFLSLATGHLTLLSAFSISPLLIYLYISFSEKPSIKKTLVIALTSLIISSYELRVFYVLAIIFIVYIIYFLFFSKYPLKHKLDFLIKNLVTGFFYILLNLYWILGYTLTDTITENSITNRDLFGNQFLNILNSLTSFHPFWTTQGVKAFEVQEIPLLQLVILILFLVSTVFIRSFLHRFFLIVALIGIFLSKQSGIPFEGFYLWMYENFLGFGLFREATKFYFISNLGISICIGILISFLVENKSNVTKALVILISILIVSLSAINTYQLVNGKIGTLFIPRSIPEDYLKFQEFQEKNKDFYRTAWVPNTSRWGYFDERKPQVNFSINTLLGPEKDSILNYLNIKYVLIPLVDLENDDNFWIYHGYLNNKNINHVYYQKLNESNYLKEVDLKFSDLKIFENLSFKELIWTDSEVFKNIIKFEKINNQLYKVVIPNNFEAKNIKINFSQSYHPSWRLSSSQPENTYFYNPKDFLVSEKGPMNTNSFSTGLNENSLSTEGYYTFYIYFQPQFYLNVGSIVSLVTLIVVVFLTTYLSLFKRLNLTNLFKPSKNIK